ncbi:hypothetical protein PILCRDRAFT_14004 [Piloderma croceum F 1598]|uniref:Uncharacterized protein n=1 Tax=Piloderma croceum (strain F 1598) TaxID=765440 RepID=A0A0C3EQS5_PILCF|nr:hypothetical protein PILCRDRAFT_14004 [Piloderma croceum F 1598]
MTSIIQPTAKLGAQLSKPLPDIKALIMSSPIGTVITPDSDIPRYVETNYDVLLRTQAHRHGAMLREADYVQIRAISYPHWEKERAVPIWIVNPKLMKTREEYPSELPKLDSQKLLHLCNEDLAEHSKGFKLHSARGRQGKMYVAVPDYLIAEREMLDETNFSSLGQRYVKGKCGMRPPLRPWEKKKGRKHPAEREIVKFMNGEGDGFIKEWNEEYIDRMT